MKTLFFLLLLGCLTVSYSQEIQKDTLPANELNEVIVVGTKTPLHEKQFKTLATVDEFLQKSNKIDLIKRGAYAWEPLINGMATERTVITIEGMRIFGACTDKMDPITSYVEVSNLSEATVASGQQGATHGNTIGGSIDLKRKDGSVQRPGWDLALLTGYESNNNQKIAGAGVNHKNDSFYINTDVMFRDADNYRAGNDKEMLFSQFTKLNLSTTSGYKLTENKLIEGSVIFDRATDVGYPSLPMDVSLAEALITSLKYELKPLGSKIVNWESKIYFNTITHTMDDTKRPFVPIHMDMPGWSDTYGFYSNVKAHSSNHHLSGNVNGFYNRSVAEMTMYPSDPNENLMFMYTWPDVRTLYSGIHLEDHWQYNSSSALTFATTLGYHQNEVASEFGLQSLQIFYPEMSDTKSRFLKSFSTNYSYEKNGFVSGGGIAFGERAPSVSEGYGFYLYNSFDSFDYIGNPNLENEQSLEANIYIGKTYKKWTAKVTSSYFHIKNYIIGIPDANVAPMTIGANGIKIYSALDYATIWSNDLTLKYAFNANFLWSSKLQYYLGKDNDNENLPFMSPLSYASSLGYSQNKWNGILFVKGNATQTNFNPSYGEDRTPSFAIFDASVGRKFNWNANRIQVNAGVENLLDAYYSTFTDWNNLPRMGRNFFVNISFR
ncbi:TonB-dependent receptor [Flavobacterium sp. SM2513]|uniref:TonB-dependent receptor plug domain-containing protein n=1 Tax=Flavobacterium sp. SM2513 TaxID=3424766 RepID=UPI003D7FB37D